MGYHDLPRIPRSGAIPLWGELSLPSLFRFRSPRGKTAIVPFDGQRLLANGQALGLLYRVVRVPSLTEQIKWHQLVIVTRSR